MCGTVSSWDAPNYYDVQATFSNINSNAEAHFGASSIGGATVIPTLTATHTYWATRDSLTFSYIATETSVGTWFTDLRGHTVEPTVAASGLEITLTTPFIYQPTRGANAATEDPERCFQGDGTENFGYVPQTLVDFLASDSHYLHLYPDLTACLPAGPSILPVTEECRDPDAIIIQSTAGGDLTESTVSTVLPTGPVNEVVPSASIPFPSPHESLPPTPGVGSIINSVLNTLPTPEDKAIGSTTTINGTPLLVIPQTTIPLANVPSGLTGSTTTVNGTPFLVIPSQTTIPALPGSITLISGSTFAVFTGPTTVPVNGELSLSGRTTVIGGVTEVVISSATTVPVSLPTGPNFVQVSGGNRGRSGVFKFAREVVRGFGGRFR